MAANSDKLFPASFKGFSFLVDEETEPKLGRKIVIHDYPNSGKRFAQDLGPVVGEFEFNGYVKGPNFMQRKDEFKEILGREGGGTLVTPNSGAVNVKALPYSIDYNHKKIGVIVFKLKFTISNTDVIPAIVPSTVQDVFQAGDDARFEMQNQFESGYQVPSSRKDVLTAINDYQAAFFDTVQKYSFQTITNNTRIQNLVRSIQTNVVKLIRDPQELAKKLIFGNRSLVDALFATFSALFTDPDLDDADEVKVSASSALDISDFGDNFKDNGTAPSISGIPLWPDDTANRILRNNNRVLMVESVKLNSLILAFEVGANFDYQTSNQIDDAVIDLEEAYAEMILVGDPVGILSNNDEMKILIDNVKNACYSVLEQKAQQVYSLTELRFRGPNSVMNLSYKLYKERLKTTAELEELAQLVSDLNPILTPTEMVGNVTVFES